MIGSVHDSIRDTVSQPQSNDSVTGPRLPAEILANIIEIAILTASPCPRTSSTSASSGKDLLTSPFSTPLRASYASAWAWTAQLLFVSKYVHSIARPMLLRTLTLDTDAATLSFFNTLQVSGNGMGVLGEVQRAWLGNVSALKRGGLDVDPVGWRLDEAGWYEECTGGFVVGHAYASRSRKRRKRGKKEKMKQYRSVSVYWAEEQLVEEVSDPDRSSSDDEASNFSSIDSDIERQTQVEPDIVRSFPSISQSVREDSQRRRSHHDSESIRDPRIDRPREPAWQTLYSRQRRTSSSAVRAHPVSGRGVSSRNHAPSDPNGTQIGPSEGDLDPWDMQDAQERLAALANSPDLANVASTETNVDTHVDRANSTSSNVIVSPLESAQIQIRRRRRRRREIYAYYLCIVTLEQWINPLLSSIRSLRLITITLFPGYLLDDDKLEHMLRRILSPSECPRLETLLIRIVFDPARKFGRTKTIVGAVDRIGDERLRVMMVNKRVGEGELAAIPSGVGDEAVNPLSRKIISLTKEGWWVRVLQHNHHPQAMEIGNQDYDQDQMSSRVERNQQRQHSNWQMLLPPDQHSNPTHLVNLLHHCDPWPDYPDPVT